ncbi:Os02g0793400, partial [Oryza sativa Japonica Group]
GLLLLRVTIVTTTAPSRLENDYFVYSYQWPGRPSLRRLPSPPFPFHDDEAGILPLPVPGGEQQFKIAVLSVRLNGFNLRLFDSASWSWTNVGKVIVASPQRPFPIKIPRNAARLNQHITTTAITLGGEDGTMGWVDLYRGILFCDVLSGGDHPTLVGVPLPLPRRLVDRGAEVEGCPKANRGIAVLDGCLRMVELEVHGEILPTRDPETGHLDREIKNWELYMYTNSKITGAWEDWQLVHGVEASQINIDQAIHDSLLQPGLLRDKMQDGKERKLHNLLTSQPALSLDGEGVVYLLTKAKFMQRQAWVLAVDVKGNKILGLAEFGTDTYLGLSLAYCPSRISSYMDAWTVQTISYILVLYKFLVL